MKIKDLCFAIDKEIDFFDNTERSIVFLNNSAKKRKDFFVLPRREALSYKSIGFFIGNEAICENVSKYIDGKATYI